METPEIEDELQQMLDKNRQRPASSRLPLLGHLLVLAVLAACWWLLRTNYLNLAAGDLPLARKILWVVLACSLISTLTKAIQIFLVNRIDDAATRYNLNRVVYLLAAILACLLIASMVFANLYAGLVSFGVISLVLGLALQTPVTSFIGWIYLLVRAPYRVGDRIKLGELKGDVIDVGYLDTTLWEFGGDYLSGDHPSGRIIRFPNSQVLEAAVINYSWSLFPYVWNELKLQIGYDSDLEFVARTMERVATEQLGTEMSERIDKYREILARTPVNELEVRAHPTVSFRVSENTWLEAVVRFLVLPREAGKVKGSLLLLTLQALNQEPERVRFPKGDAR